MKVGWAFRLSSADEMDELIDVPHPFPGCKNSHRSRGLASFRATNIRYSLPDGSPKRKRHFRLGGPYPLIRWSSEGMKSAVFGDVMPRPQGLTGAPAVKDWGLVQEAGTWHSDSSMGLVAAPEYPPFPLHAARERAS